MSQKTAHIMQVRKGSITFAARTGSNHWIVVDGPEEFGGSDASARPKELLLLALATCTGSDIASILVKKRAQVEQMELNITAEESEEHPKVFTAIHIEYVFHGSAVDTASVERAIELSLTKYCGVHAMLKQATSITHSYRIEK